MINEIIVNGSIDTTLHSFSITTSGMDITISAGEYYRGGQIVFSDTAGGTITIPTTANVNYELYLMSDNTISLYQWINANDFSLFYKNNMNNIIDRIAWFTVGDNVTTLDNVTINFVKVIQNAN